jgi:hypothetical protein
MSRFVHAMTNENVAATEVERAPVLLHAGLHGSLQSVVFDDEAMFQDWLR